MRLSEELKWRGFVYQTTLNNLEELDKSSLSFYLGVDPSADSMTIGNLAAMMMVRHFINYGHKAFLLVGGATGLIGDPDGKATERPQKAIEEIDKNKKAIVAQYKQVFNGADFQVVDNYDWFSGIGFIEFLRSVGKHVPLSQMLGRDFVQARLGEGGAGISYAEFSYSLIQGYDFLHLFRNNNVTLQICGADQWGNSITGVDLIRRIEGKEAHVYSTPLIINKATGIKFGKSEDGAIWLDSNKTSVYKFYQFWINTDDLGVIDYMKVYTLLSREEIEDIQSRHNADPSSRIAQKALAHEVTTIVHGKGRCESVEKVTDVLFGKSKFEDLNNTDLDMLALEIPSVTLSGDKTIVDALFESGATNSKGEARRFISAGAISINGNKVTEDVIIAEKSLIKKGKNTFILVR